MILADSHGRGLAENLSAKLPSWFSITASVRPGAAMSRVLEEGELISASWAPNDYIIILGGTNDVTGTSDQDFQKDLEKIQQLNARTKVFLYFVPQRFDEAPLNKRVHSLNKMIQDCSVSQKLTFPASRKAFTRHGLHLSYRGKQELCQDLSRHLLEPQPPLPTWVPRKPHTPTDKKLSSITDNLEMVLARLKASEENHKENEEVSRMYVNVHVKGISFRALVDSGATHTVVNSEFWYDLQKHGAYLRKQTVQAQVADGRSIEVVGVARLPLQIQDHIWTGDCYFVKRLPYDMILGFNSLRGLSAVLDFSSCTLTLGQDTSPIIDLLPLDLPPGVPDVEPYADGPREDVTPEQHLDFQKFLEHWKQEFSQSPGRTSLVKHRLYLEKDMPPIKQRYYPVSPATQEIINREVDKLLDKGVIEPSESGWSSPLVLVEKKALRLGGPQERKWRLCVDFRKVNDATKKNAFPLPHIHHLLDQLKDSNFVSSLDLLSGYHQIEMDHDSKPLTAFTVPGKGLFQYTVMPFGLHSAPATFQSLMQRILQPILYKHAWVYLDDILIASSTLEEHLGHLEEVLKLLHKAGLQINWDKSFFLRPRTEYLGFIVGQGEILVSPSKVEGIQHFQPPRNIKQVRSFLGLCGWYRRFLPDFATLTQPLTQLLHKDEKFNWTSDQQQAFESIKAVLSEAPTLYCPDFSAPFEVQTDASLVGTGGVLLQHVNGEEKIVAYTSRTLSSAEKNYSVTERECLAVIHAIEKFRPYLENTSFTVVTDHASLVWLNNLKNPTGRLARWILRLGQFDYKIVHRKGKFMTVADALSRSPYNIQIASLTAEVPDFEDIRDPWYTNLMEKVQANPDAYPAFIIRGNHLFKAVHDRQLGRVVEKLYVPNEYRSQLLEQNHASLPSAHLGQKKTLERISRLYYWPSIQDDVRDRVTHCRVCQQHKPSNDLPPGYMKTETRALTPWQMISVDIIGPLPRTRRNKKYIIVFVDVCTKWTIATAVPSATAAAVTKSLLDDLIMQHGVPEILLCDNGSQFISHSFKDTCKQYHIKVRHTPRYYPQGNPVERYNRTIKTALAIFAEADHRDWDEHLKFAIFAQRTSYNESTGFTPARLVYGRELRSFYQLTCDTDRPQMHEFDAAEYDGEHRRLLTELRNKAQAALQKAKTRQAHPYNLRHRHVTYEVNDLVWKKNFAQSNAAAQETAKLFPKFVGPFVVAEVVSPTQYRLETVAGKDAGLWPSLHLKPVL